MGQTTYAEEFTQAFAYNGSNLVEYQGWARPGTAKTAARWKICKLTYSGNFVTDIQWADGTASFTKVWNDRATYSYS